MEMNDQNKPCDVFNFGKYGAQISVSMNKVNPAFHVHIWTNTCHTNAIFQCLDDIFYLSMNPLLHGCLPQTKVPQGHQSKATMLLPAWAIICQNHSYMAY